MAKKLTYITIAPIFLVVSLFLISATPFFYEFEFNKNNTYQDVDLPASQIPVVIRHLNGYLAGTEGEFNHQVMIDGALSDVYGQREILHMQDVRTIFDAAKLVAVFLSVIILWQCIICIVNKDLLNYLKNLSRAGIIGMLVITAALLFLILNDFSSAFIAFHHIFFNNDLWLLNPETDRLIQMLPQVFFKDAALSILGLSFVFAILFRVIIHALSRRNNA